MVTNNPGKLQTYNTNNNLHFKIQTLSHKLDSIVENLGVEPGDEKNKGNWTFWKNWRLY